MDALTIELDFVPYERVSLSACAAQDAANLVANVHAQARTGISPQPQTAILQPQPEPHRPKAGALAGLSLINSSR